ncbi:MAG: carbon-nitrogen hydrolase family protein [Candidatus Aramenus sp.]|nr:carbon-nitrogen hydrolase family protein [Candidatus Aramenus sp.]
MRIGIVQTSSTSSALSLTEQALASGAQLVLLPEKWVKTLDEVPLSEFQRLALKYTAYVIPGAFEDGVSVISPIIDDKGKIRGVAKKVHLFGSERERLFPGTSLTVFSYNGIKFGIAICYDVDFPETVRSLVKKGVEVLLVPSKIDKEGLPIWREYLKVRALENRIAVINSNALDLPNYPGHSAALLPYKKGNIVDTMTVGELGEEEGFMVVDVDPLSYFYLRASRLKEIVDVEVNEIQS